LRELRNFKPSTSDRAATADLATSFSAPSPPPKPKVEGSDIKIVEENIVQVAEAEWPTPYNPIDDPVNYNDEFNYSTDVDDGALFPKRIKEADYHDH